MYFDSRLLTLAKDAEHPHENQDACGVDAERGIAVIADGVSSAIFSAQWAAVLTEAVLADPPDPDDHDAFAYWLYQQRVAWSERIDTTGLAWFQRAKLPTGAFSTLLWLRLQALDDAPAGAFGAARMRGFAIGDSCLFHIRNDELVRSFPLQTSAELEADPVVLGSVDLSRDSLLQFARLDELCYADDLLILCTDALADWALRCYEAGQSPVWHNYWDMPAEDWQAEILWLRQERHIRYDDTTLLLMRVAEQRVETRAPETPHRAAEAPAADDETILEATEMVEPAAPEAAFDWLAEARKLKSVPEQLAEQAEHASEQFLRGFKSLKDKALEKYRELKKKKK